MAGVARSVTMQFSASQEGQRERRRVVRRPLNLRVDIPNDDSTVRSFTATNIGLGGMFLCADSSSFKLDDIIKPELFLNFNGLYMRCCVVVRVMHVSADGIGACFHQYDGCLFRYIYKMMYESSHQILSASPDLIAKQRANNDLSQTVSFNGL